jgi:S1-C subfamily serine protease
MSVYPSNEHVYRFDLKPGEYDATQIIYMLEDKLDLQLSQYDGQEQTDGWATIDNLTSRLDLRSFTPLTDAQLALVAEVITSHKPVAPLYRGPFSGIITRYRNSIGQVLVRHSETSDQRFATGFLFGKSDRLITAAHVIRPPWQLREIRLEAETVRGHLIGFEPDLDVALIRLERPRAAPPLRVRRLFKAEEDLGRTCVVAGFPDVPGTHPQISFREVQVTAVRRSYLTNQDLIELSDNLAGGFSGGPLLTLGSSVAGMVVGYTSAESSNIAVAPIGRGTALCLTDFALAKWIESNPEFE